MECTISADVYFTLMSLGLAGLFAFSGYCIFLVLSERMFGTGGVSPLLLPVSALLGCLQRIIPTVYYFVYSDRAHIYLLDLGPCVSIYYGTAIMLFLQRVFIVSPPRRSSKRICGFGAKIWWKTIVTSGLVTGWVYTLVDIFKVSTCNGIPISAALFLSKYLGFFALMAGSHTVYLFIHGAVLVYGRRAIISKGNRQILILLIISNLLTLATGVLAIGTRLMVLVFPVFDQYFEELMLTSAITSMIDMISSLIFGLYVLRNILNPPIEVM